MDILWPALGIAVIAVFVLYILAQHWHRLLREQAWTIRHLSRRVDDLEQMGDPAFRRRLGESSPVPLEEVFHFTFRLAERFWRDALSLTDENRNFVRSFGSFVGSLKLERWRSHTVATISEILPDSGPASGTTSSTTGWRTRSIDFYPGQSGGSESVTLWEVPLERANGSGAHPPSLELVLQNDSLELRANGLVNARLRPHNGPIGAEIALLRVPLDAVRLANFRSADPAARSGPAGNGQSPLASQLKEQPEPEVSAVGWERFYASSDEALGIEWELRVRDLNRKAEWDRWKILETAP